MASISSNLPEIRGKLDALADTMRFDRKPKSSRRSVGAQLLAVTAGIVEARTVQGQLEPDGSRLARLKPSTLRRKAEQGFPSTISVETGQMMSMEQVMGEQEVTPRSAAMTYGTGPEARAKAASFTEGHPPYQEPRPFYDLGRTGEQSLDDYIRQEIIDAQISELG